MAHTVVSVNGVDVYSDLAICAISNDRIEFQDGSWCNVATGEIVNKGSGNISFHSPSSSSAEEKNSSDKKKTSCDYSYEACKLIASNVDADLRVELSSDTQMSVLVKGPSKVVDSISVEHQADTVVIQGKRSGMRSSCTSSSISINIGGFSFSSGRKKTCIDPC